MDCIEEVSGEEKLISSFCCRQKWLHHERNIREEKRKKKGPLT